MRPSDSASGRRCYEAESLLDFIDIGYDHMISKHYEIIY
jgi:hypothetical protein